MVADFAYTGLQQFQHGRRMIYAVFPSYFGVGWEDGLILLLYLMLEVLSWKVQSPGSLFGLSGLVRAVHRTCGFTQVPCIALVGLI